MQHSKLILKVILVGLLFSKMVTAQDFQVFNQDNTPVFTTNFFKAPAVDKDGVLYVGTANNGFYKYNNGAWQRLSVLTNNNINDIKVDEQNRVWIAQYGRTGAQAITGGVVSFSDSLLNNYTYYGALSPSSLPTRNVRAIYVDPKGYYTNSRPVVWTAHLGDITGTTTTNPAVGVGLNEGTPNFSKITSNISTNAAIIAITGNENEVWVAANGNGGVTQILRYGTLSRSFIGAYDNTNTPDEAKLNTTSYIGALLIDNQNRKWIGLRNGEGVLMQAGSVWKKMNALPLFSPTTIVNNNAIFQDSKGRILVGTSGGLLVYESGDIDLVSNWKKYTTLDGLPSDNITGIAENKKSGEIVITTAVGVAFWKNTSNIELAWDKSYKYNENNKPIGLVADGVSRVYVKVSSPNGISNVKKVRIKIIQEVGIARSEQGSIKKANELIQYSTEANDANKLEDIDSVLTSGSDSYTFWYVAPEDFTQNPSSFYADASERIETLRAYYTFLDGSIDSVDKDVKIIRPPLMLVHGLNSNPDAWNNFRPNSGIHFISSPLFLHTKAVKMDGLAIFNTNALTLLDNETNPNSFQAAITAMHNQGFACTQVDYVCHSMGGLMARTAITKFERLYKNNNAYAGANYGKGYIHKMITINSPHNGSPLADLIVEFAPLLPPISTRILGGVFNNAHLGFVEPMPSFDVLPLPTKFEANGAVKNLAIRVSNGGINLPETVVPNHLLTGNIAWYGPEAAQTITNLGPLLGFIDEILGGARDQAVDISTKAFLTSLQGLTKLARVWSFIEWYFASLGYPNFLGNSDLIVPLASQQIRQAPSAPHISNFLNSPASFIDANHVAVLDRLDFGQRVMDLINSPLKSNLFAAAFPANTDPEPPIVHSSKNMQITQLNVLPVSTTFSTQKIEIISALPHTVKTDSIISFQLNIKDTVGLAYLKVYFQNQDTTTLSRNTLQTFHFKANYTMLDSQFITAVAVYDKPTQIEYHVDTTLKVVSPAQMPSHFRFKENYISIIANQSAELPIEAMYNGVWQTIPARVNNIMLSAIDTLIATVNIFKTISAKNTGTTKITADYFGLKDTITVEVLPSIFANTVITSIASGNASNPNIWSKNRIPSLLDSVIIKSGHTVICDTALKVRKLIIESGATMQINTTDSIEIGITKTGLIKKKNLNNIIATKGLKTIAQSHETTLLLNGFSMAAIKPQNKKMKPFSLPT